VLEQVRADGMPGFMDPDPLFLLFGAAGVARGSSSSSTRAITA
jgi:hypothetical protein